MKTPPVSALVAALLLLAGCPSEQPSGPDAGPDAGPEGDAGSDGGVVRTLGKRPLLGTEVENLLLDPFGTIDTSWGHFLVVLTPTSAYSSAHPVGFGRAFVSLSPQGVSAPVASLGPVSAANPAVSTASLAAPLLGGSQPFTAEVWVSAGDGKGAPAPFDGQGLTASLLPEDAPTQSYPLEVEQASATALGGRTWVKLATKAPVPMAQGGFFLIAVHDRHATFQLQAPQVLMASASSPRPPPRAEPRSEEARAAVRGYHERQRER